MNGSLQEKLRRRKSAKIREQISKPRRFNPKGKKIITSLKVSGPKGPK